MNIGIDIDGVIMDDDTYRLAHMSKFCYEHNLPPLEYPYGYETKGNWDAKTSALYRQEYFLDYVQHGPAHLFVSEITHKLHEEGHNLVIITSRHKTTHNTPEGEQMRQLTIQWLKEHNVYYDKICFAIWPKVEDIQENKIDIMIEDCVEAIIAQSKYTKHLCYDTRYNRNFTLKGMNRVFSWYDIYRNIKEME